MKRFLTVLLTLSLLVGLIASLPAFAADTDGMSFDAGHVYRGFDALSEAPLTIEATVYFPASYDKTQRGGVIIGNYYYASTNSLSIEVYANGAPRVYFIEKSGAVHDWKFDRVSLYTGDWAHLAIVFDHAADALKCYLNGELKQTISLGGTKLTAPTDSMVVGGDLRDGNVQYLNGKLRNVSLYSDVRTDAEITADAKATALDKDNLMVAYDLSDLAGTAPEVISDVSGNGNDASYIYTEKPDDRFFTDKTPVTDYAYSFAVVGDTQILSWKYPEKMAGIYDWIVANKSAKKIEYVIGLGDITQDNKDSEWAFAMEQIGKLNGVVPYSLVRGNHDLYDPQGTNQFDKYTPRINYADQVEGCYNGQNYNAYRTMRIGQLDYLFLNLDYGANDAVLSWADEVVSAHPHHNVVVTTHGYLYRDGSTLDETEVCPPTRDAVFNAFPGYNPNNGDHMWNEFVSKHENIVLVLCGHDPSDAIVTTQTKGEKGNTVTQMLIDPQDLDNEVEGSGMVAMLYFSEDGREIQVEYYAPAKEAYFLEENQFTVKIHTVAASAETTPDTEEITEVSTEEVTEETTETLTTPEASTEEATTPAATDAPEATTAASTETEAPDGGCGASVSLMILLALTIPAALICKKQKDCD